MKINISNPAFITKKNPPRSITFTLSILDDQDEPLIDIAGWLVNKKGAVLTPRIGGKILALPRADLRDAIYRTVNEHPRFRRMRSELGDITKPELPERKIEVGVVAEVVL